MRSVTKRPIGHGLFTWNGRERRGDRYGAFVLNPGTLDVPRLERLVGKRVSVTAVVVENRESHHIGDLFHGFAPSKPDIGEVVELGVATLRLEDAGWDNLAAIVMEPGDGREYFWIDPRKLYRLHDQTIDLFVEETAAEFTAAPGK